MSLAGTLDTEGILIGTHGLLVDSSADVHMSVEKGGKGESSCLPKKKKTWSHTKSHFPQEITSASIPLSYYKQHFSPFLIHYL